MTERPGFDPINVPDFEEALASRDVDQAAASGEITSDQAAEQLQQAARRHAAEHGPDLDTDAEGTVTTGGFGSGQGQSGGGAGRSRAQGQGGEPS
ncbi:MAG: hypothetical protein AVDCRST_MAG73-3962 [uncultured Thermomicrobiales bacterium]|uniref:Uncharacterized protein n=1 Tax=uncultured Thermomicrobiales bacterium TaxID=1645740 RepID=A0A6J4V0S0_9BACT|nr:MAG: hypothetical protein AVDCRST_MAG73-3962 [uncultured Thermomicrobiales bacterium]